MRQLDNYILEKLHINKDYKIDKYKPGDYLYAVYTYSNLSSVSYVPKDSFKSVEEFEEYLRNRHKDIKYLQIFLTPEAAREYETNVLPKLMKNEKNK